ncbi:hypothetical protein GCM10010964_18580 [Caldovatus sediminis]|uniref:Phage virion morphogenesis protein n=1 Tax=Caldovatus sediminis TaxID=2041189 RepID=A0A8J2ZBK6_9PROT|nr:phage virion morphogenesis protein [Caldovatus sediminis]GGG30931.1 hypothetical protein GCM10010964_18580 [Caldovatus sediminis]
MAGATIRVEIQDRALRRALARWIRLDRDPRPLLRAIGVGLAENVRDRIAAGEDPEGNPWTPLHPAYAALKRGPGILREAGMRGGLQGSVTFDVAGREVAVGTSKIYGAAHQFGATIRAKRAPRLVFRTPDGKAWGAAQEVTIPARPYLGLSRADEGTILEVAETFFARGP